MGVYTNADVCINGEQAANSAQYVGMLSVFASDDADNSPIGKWYSQPRNGECRSDEPLGATRGDGSRCTWKMRPVSRGTAPLCRGIPPFGCTLSVLLYSILIIYYNGCVVSVPRCVPHRSLLQTVVQTDGIVGHTGYYYTVVSH